MIFFNLKSSLLRVGVFLSKHNQVVFIIKHSNGTKNYRFEQGLHLALLMQRFGTLQNSQL
jgi:hypothetical protein